MEQLRRALAESARLVCGSVRVGGENPKSVWGKGVDTRKRLKYTFVGLIGFGESTT